MAHIYGLHLRQLHGHSYQPGAVQFCGSEESQAWSPDINAFLCSRRIVICLDLAGVERATLDLHIEPRRVQIRGRRQSPEPRKEKPLQTLALEIDYGPFEREVALPVEVDAERVTAQQHNGLLWIELPLR